MADQDLTIAIKAINEASKILDKAQKDFESFSNQASSEIEKVNKKYEQMGERMQKVGKDMSTYITLPIVAGFTKATMTASSFVETMNKVETVFGDNAQSVVDWGDTTRKQFGIARETALDMAALYGDMATGMGINTEQAAEMSKALTGLAGDLASFKNIRVDVAETALKSVFTGETESLKNLGIVMTQANLEAFALSRGIDANLQSMTESEKVSLRYAFVMEKSKNSIGDFAKTSQDSANQTRTFGQNLIDLSNSFGQVILPTYNKAIIKANEFVEKISETPPEIKKSIVVFAALAAAAGPVYGAIGAISAAIPSLTAGVIGLTAAMGGPTGLILALGALATATVIAVKNNKDLQREIDKMIVKQDELKKVEEGFAEKRVQLEKDRLKLLKNARDADGENARASIIIKEAELRAIAEKEKAVAIAIVKNRESVVRATRKQVNEVIEELNVLTKQKIPKIREDIESLSAGEGTFGIRQDQFGLIGALIKDDDDAIAKLSDALISAENKASGLRDTIGDISAAGSVDRADLLKGLGLEEDFVGPINAADAYALKLHEIQDAAEGLGEDGVGDAIAEAEKIVQNALKNVGTGGASSAVSSVSSQANKVNEELSKLQSNFSSTFDEAVKSYQESERAFKEASQQIQAEITTLKSSLDDLNASFQLENQRLDTSLGERVVAQEQLIAELEKQVADRISEDRDASDLEQRLQREKEALESFKSSAQGLDDEIAEARRRNALTEFERFVEDTEAKRESERAAYEEKKSLIEQEIKDKEEQLKQKEKLFKQEEAAFDQLVNSFAAGNAQMVQNAQTTVDQMKAKYAELKSVLDQIRAITAPATGEDNRTDAQVFSISGAQQPISPTVFGVQENQRTGSVSASQTVQGQASSPINISIGSVDSRDRVREVERAVSRGVQLGRVRSS